ncbi:hypothetical protein [Lederbergia citri]|uniref:Uncharacterized protein n=1 Tax=Lederbergia citri TaxID=2833580 RepID=A0A942TD90_9BACI|nr:hypothetical protein [Lederbergia citri]MBS4195791.1 hypothetical protein [Lederbergia citri]
MFINSFKGLEKTRLSFVTDATGTVHLKDNEVSRAWLKKNKQVTVFTKVWINNLLQPHTRVIDCTGLGLTVTEKNNLTLDDF